MNTRVAYGEAFWRISGNKIEVDYDVRDPDDDAFYTYGNYYTSKEAAQHALDSSKAKHTAVQLDE